jgi:hypothetical protein
LNISRVSICLQINTEIRALFHFFSLRGLSRPDYLSQIAEGPRQDIEWLSGVRRWYLTFAPETFYEDDARGWPLNSSISTDIDAILEVMPLSFDCHIGEPLDRPKDTVPGCVTNEIGSNELRFRWILQKLSDENKAKYLRMAAEILEILRQGPTKSNHLITGDKRSIYCCLSHYSQLLPKESARP